MRSKMSITLSLVTITALLGYGDGNGTFSGTCPVGPCYKCQPYQCCCRKGKRIIESPRHTRSYPTF